MLTPLVSLFYVTAESLLATKWHGKTSEFVTSILVLSVSTGCK